ncbi:copper chaperone PCu(A)C [Undibacterium terreum]|uniref:Transporter n=1 Tax=Undibacterium terreum TaxID=1224302 RepID=A0A916U8J7_9BURK|nr:copper chaperone PCu(A)C [Undibacterium terreum]GGC63791.1 transporter [Undibacterium terreum]
MNYLKQFSASAALFLAVLGTAQAQVKVDNAWVRATVPQQKATGAFMQLSSAKDTRLVEAKSPVAGIVEIHQMAMQDNVMKMRQVAFLDMPAGQALELKPGGFHIMLMDLKAQVKDGDKVPVTLVFEGKDKKKETLEVTAIARPLNSSAADANSHSH